LILALESSCDETAVAVFDPAGGLAGEWVQSQIELHGRHGGVVPALAAREHLRHFAPLLALARDSRGGSAVTRVAVTRGPGLAPCLALGVAAAKAVALDKGVPLVGVNHLRAHVWSPFLALHAEAPPEFSARLEAFLPHLSLVVSGGHTLLCAVDADRRITALSSTRDDAAGEALDKGAKLLGLGYPGGPLIERFAAEGRDDAFAFPRGLERSGDLDFSFSGLKTSLRYLLEKLSPPAAGARLPDLCASYQRAVVEVLASKTRTALSEGGFRSLGLSGGVANNRRLREACAAEAARAGISFFAADPAHTGDNAGMVAFAAWADPAGAVDEGMGLGIEPGLSLGG
jgi:N6-L-threonylcarbamoyladenine synthase